MTPSPPPPTPSGPAAADRAAERAADRVAVLYRERLSPPLWWVIPPAGMVASVAVALAAALGPGAAAVGALVTAALTVLAAVGLSRAVLEVRSDGIRVDGVLLPFEILTGARALGPDEAALVRGQGYDVRGWYRLRGWIPTAILITLRDPRDPTPFWYVSSRTPELAVAAVAEAVTASQAGRAPEPA